MTADPGNRGRCLREPESDTKFRHRGYRHPAAGIAGGNRLAGHYLDPTIR